MNTAYVRVLLPALLVAMIAGWVSVHEWAWLFDRYLMLAEQASVSRAQEPERRTPSVLVCLIARQIDAGGPPMVYASGFRIRREGRQMNGPLGVADQEDWLSLLGAAAIPAASLVGAGFFISACPGPVLERPRPRGLAKKGRRVLRRAYRKQMYGLYVLGVLLALPLAVAVVWLIQLPMTSIAPARVGRSLPSLLDGLAIGAGSVVVGLAIGNSCLCRWSLRLRESGWGRKHRECLACRYPLNSEMSICPECGIQELGTA